MLNYQRVSQLGSWRLAPSLDSPFPPCRTFILGSFSRTYNRGRNSNPKLLQALLLLVYKISNLPINTCYDMQKKIELSSCKHVNLVNLTLPFFLWDLSIGTYHFWVPIEEHRLVKVALEPQDVLLDGVSHGHQGDQKSRNWISIK